MVRRRFKGFRRAARVGSRGFRRSSGRSSGSGLIQIDAMAYGAIRPMVSNLITPLTSMLPFGQLADEAGMGILNYLIAKKVGGTIGKVATKGLIIENAMIGSTLSSGLMGSSSSAQSSTIYG